MTSVTLKLKREQVEAIRLLAGTSISRYCQRVVAQAIESGDLEIGNPKTEAEELACDVLVRERAKRIREKSIANFVSRPMTLYQKNKIARGL